MRALVLLFLLGLLFGASALASAAPTSTVVVDDAAAYGDALLSWASNVDPTDVESVKPPNPGPGG